MAETGNRKFSKSVKMTQGHNFTASGILDLDIHDFCLIDPTHQYRIEGKGLD